MRAVNEGRRAEKSQDMIIHEAQQSVPTDRIALHQDDEDVLSVCLACDSVVTGARELQMATF